MSKDLPQELSVGFLSAVRERLQVLLGHRGDGMERAITPRSLGLSGYPKGSLPGRMGGVLLQDTFTWSGVAETTSTSLQVATSTLKYQVAGLYSVCASVDVQSATPGAMGELALFFGQSEVCRRSVGVSGAQWLMPVTLVATGNPGATPVFTIKFRSTNGGSVRVTRAGIQVMVGPLV